MYRGGLATPSVTGRNTVQSFRNAVDSLNDTAQRLKQVCIESLDYAECIQKYDSPNTLFFVDPPYLDAEHYYSQGDFSLEDHYRLSDLLPQAKGKVMITHYVNDTYDKLYAGWQRYEYESFKGSSKAGQGATKPETIEVLYTNFTPELKTRSLFDAIQ